MILNRIANAFKQQDWFVVFLEVLIVVVGIFLGLQVDDWNESRKYRQEEAIYVAKIHDDLVAMEADLLDKLEGFNLRRNTMINALQALETCDSSASATESIQWAMQSYQNAPSFNYLDATYNEMVSSGALARIHNQDLKSGIASTFSSLNALNTFVRNIRISIPVVDAIIWDHITFSLNYETGRQLATFNIAEICTNTQVRNAVVEMIDIQSDARGSYERALVSVGELLRLLDVISQTKR